MSIGQQLFEFLQYCTDTKSYCVQDVHSCIDAKGRHLCIKELYINEEENQVYLIVEDENENPFHVSVHQFITMMGGPFQNSYEPLYQLRNETKVIKKLYFKKYIKALSKFGPDNKKFIKQIFIKLFKNESN